MTASKIVISAASGAARGAGLDVDECFSCHLYDGGVSAPLTINNGIDLSGEGGLVWIKNRTSAVWHQLADTERGANKMLSTNSGNAEASRTEHVKSFTSTGFTIGNDNDVNYDVIGGSQDDKHVSWTFRKAPKFFDIVTYTGNATARTISHNLGSVPGMIIIKRLDSNDDWYIYHRGNTSNPETEYLRFTDNATADSANVWNDTAPTATEFTINQYSLNNANGGSFVAYLFAHNNSDGEFGPNSDQDIIKCGSYSGNGSSLNSVSLGFEPQWVMIKKTNSSASWYIFDVMRGMAMGDADFGLIPNSSNAEMGSQNWINPTATGFDLTNANANVNGTGDTYIYMAIRRGPLAEPESASDVFAISTYGQGGSAVPSYTSNFPVDMYFERKIDATFSWFISSRLTAPKYMKTNATDAEVTDSLLKYDFMDGVYNGAGVNSAYQAWMWRRAPGYFDVCTYTGNYTDGRTITHNLGVAPEMIWVKLRDTYSAEWMVFHKDLTTNHNLQLDSDVASADYSGRVRSPTATTFTVGNDTSVNRQSPLQYIAYLFATVAGVSKVGSYTGSGASQTIDCGFSNGAKFVLIKCTSQNSTPWLVFDSVRGLTANVDPHLRLDSTDAEVSQAANDIEPDNSGFIVNSVNNTNNGNGESYIFYAIAT